MGDWTKVLEVIISENAETAAEDDAETIGQPSDERLFLKEDGWDGPKYLRYSCILLDLQRAASVEAYVQ